MQMGHEATICSRASVYLLLPLLAACDLLLPFASHSDEPAPVDTLAPVDTGVDVDRSVPRDLAVTGEDASLSGPRLSCSAPEVVGSSHPAGVLTQPAMLPSGAVLYAKGSTAFYRIERASDGVSFTASWQPAPETLSGASDPAFFQLDQRDYLLVSSGELGTRTLSLCGPSANDWHSCEPLSIIGPYAAGIDMDGPSVAIVGAKPLMLFNAESTTLSPEVFEARPIKADDLTRWQAVKISALDLKQSGEDDPAISPDGRIVVFTLEDPAGARELYVSSRASAASPFSAPVVLEGVRGSSNTPLLWRLPSGTMELYLGRDSKIHRAACVVDQ